MEAREPVIVVDGGREPVVVVDGGREPVVVVDECCGWRADGNTSDAVMIIDSCNFYLYEE